MDLELQWGKRWDHSELFGKHTDVDSCSDSRDERDDQSIIEDGQPRVDNDLYGHTEQRLYGYRRGHLRRVTGKRINSVHLHD